MTHVFIIIVLSAEDDACSTGSSESEDLLPLILFDLDLRPHIEKSPTKNKVKELGWGGAPQGVKSTQQQLIRGGLRNFSRGGGCYGPRKGRSEVIFKLATKPPSVGGFGSRIFLDEGGGVRGGGVKPSLVPFWWTNHIYICEIGCSIDT